MCHALNFDPKSAQAFDNGVFWIDYDSLINFFDVLYMNWNPALFTSTYGTHRCWNSGVGPVKDLYNLGDNPQFRLEVRPTGATAVWVLLTRHITEIEDFRNNKEYITLLVYKTGGKRVFYPFDPPAYIEGVRINSPHYLCKMVLPAGAPQLFTLVVSQYEKINTITYSLRVYATCPFALTKIKNLCKQKTEVSGKYNTIQIHNFFVAYITIRLQILNRNYNTTCLYVNHNDFTGKWSGASAGGCPNHPESYRNNPTYQMRLDQDLPALSVALKAPKEVPVGFEITCVEARNTEDKNYFKKKMSGVYRSVSDIYKC